MANSPDYQNELTAAVVRHAKRIGADPLDLLTVYSYETGGTLDPWQKGPRTQWGQHIGFIQMDEPQRQKYGYAQGRSIDELVGSTVDYLVDNGFKPGMGLHQMYATINTGSPYTGHRSDAHNGGAPGSAYDKVNTQMAGHRKRAEGLLGGGTYQSSYLPEQEPSLGQRAIEGQMAGGGGALGSDVRVAGGGGNTPRYVRQWEGDGEPPADVFIDPAGKYEHLYGAGGQLEGGYQNEAAKKRWEELEAREPGRYQLIDANELEDWQKKWEEDNKNKGLWDDTKLLLKSGTAELANAIDGGFRGIPGIGDAYGKASDWLNEQTYGMDVAASKRHNQEYVEARLTDEMQAARQKEWMNDDWSMGDAWGDWRAYFAGAAESLPSTAASMTPAGWVGRAAYAGALARGLGQAAANKAAQRAAWAAGSATEAFLVGGAAASEVAQEIANMPREVLEQSDAVKTLMSQGMGFDEAVASLSKDARQQAFLLGGLAGGLFGGVGDHALAKILTERLGGNLAKRVAGGAGRGFIAEGLEETLQEGGQQMAQNVAMQNIDPNRDIMAGVPNAMAGGFAIGGTMGAGMGSVAGAASPHRPLRNALEHAQAAAQERQTSGLGGAVRDETPPMGGQSMPVQEMPAVQPSGLGQDVMVRVEAPDIEPFTGRVKGERAGFVDVMEETSGEVVSVPSQFVRPLAQQATQEATPVVGQTTDMPPPQVEGYGSEQTRSSLPRTREQVRVSDLAIRPNGGNVIVDLPDTGRFTARVVEWTDGGALIRREDGTELVVPRERLYVDGRDGAAIEAEDEGLNPPIKREKVKTPLTREAFGKQVTLPDDLHARLYDYGQEQFVSRKLARKSQFSMRERDNAARKALAQELGIAPERLDAIADDYRIRTLQALRKAAGTLPVKMHKVPSKILARYQNEYRKSSGQEEAVSQPEPKNAENLRRKSGQNAGQKSGENSKTQIKTKDRQDKIADKKEDIAEKKEKDEEKKQANNHYAQAWNAAKLPARQAILDKAKVKHSPKLDWDKHTKTVQGKIAAVLDKAGDMAAMMAGKPHQSNNSQKEKAPETKVKTTSATEKQATQKDKRQTPQQREEQAVASMRRVIETKADVTNAVTRPDIGQIDFVWGDEGGQIDAKGKRKGAYGVAHILEARQRKDGLSQEQAEKVAEEVAKVVATAGQIKSQQVGDITRTEITDGTHTAILSKEGSDNGWLLTGWENFKDPDDIGQARVKTETTHLKPTTRRLEVGAESSENNVSQDLAKSKEEVPPKNEGKAEVKGNKAETATTAQSDKEQERGEQGAVEATGEKRNPKIEDFGEKIEGAAKMKYAERVALEMGEIDGEEIAAKPLSQTWPLPDYNKLIENGVALKNVALIRALRESIEKKPSYEVMRWARKVKRKRDIALRLLANEDVTIEKPRIGESLFVEELAIREGWEDIEHKAALYEAVGHQISLKDYELYVSRYSAEEYPWIITGNGSIVAKGKSQDEVISAFKDKYSQIVNDPMAEAKKFKWNLYKSDDGKGTFIGIEVNKRVISVKDGFANAKEAMVYIDANLEELVQIAKEKAKKKSIDFRAYGDGKDKDTSQSFSLAVKTGAYRWIKLKGGFKSVEEVWAYLRKNRQEMEELAERLLSNPDMRGKENTPRVGKDWRKGKDITPEKFQEAFGFRGVQFGNWVNGRERQDSLNEAYDGFMDLAAVLGVEPKALSLNGELGMAFGARGIKGAKAHYERGHVVINLTKKKGAGTLAHEWWHGLDNYFGRKDGNANRYATKHYARNKQSETIRQEVADAFTNVINTINSGDYKKRSSNMDAVKHKGYWDSDIEMSARAFEAYVIDRLKEQGGKSDYLANIKLPEEWGHEETYPYPLPEEMAAIKPAFDKLFEMIETRTHEDGRVEMYSIKGETNKSKYTITTLKTELQSGDLGKYIERLIEDGKVRIVAKADNSPDGVQGWTSDNGTITLVAGEIAQGEAQAVLLHEMFHSGVKPLMEEAVWQKMMKQLDSLYAQFEDPHNKGANEFFKQAHARVALARERQGEMSDQLAVEEFAAYAVEEYERAPKALKSWVANLLDQLRAWILRQFGKQFGQITPAQLRALAVSALKAQARQTGGRYPMPATMRYSIKKAQDKIAGLIETVPHLAFNATSTVDIGEVSVRLADTVRDEVGIDIKGFNHSVDAFAIRHIRKRHGNAKSEAKQGQVAVTDKDLLRIPEIVSDPDFIVVGMKNERHNDVIAYVKRFPEDNVTFYLEEARTGRERLAAITMRKHPAAMDTLSVAERAPSYAQGDSGNKVKIIPFGKKSSDSRRYSIASDAMERVSEVTPARVVEELRGRWTDLKPHMLKAVPLNYFSELKRPNMVAVDDYLKTKRALDAYRGKKHAEADKIAQTWLKLAKFGKKNIQNLSDLMHETTLKGIDPSKTDAETKAKKGYDELVAKYNKLPPLAQQLYSQVRDAYKVQAQELDEIILANVEKAEKIAQEKLKREFEQDRARIEKSDRDPASKRSEIEALGRAYNNKRQRSEWSMQARLLRLRQAFEQSRVSEPYFPLARFGQYFVSVKDKQGEVLSFSRREKAADRDRLALEMRKAYPDAHIQVGVLKQGALTQEAMDPRMIAEIETILGGAKIEGDVSSTIMEQIWQRYLTLMPDQSVRKNFIHRKGIAGFDADALRAFSHHMFHAAHQMGRLKFGMDLAEYVNKTQEQAQLADDPTKGMRLANELRKRHEWVMNPTGSKFAQTMNSTAFVWYLAATPAAAIVNMTQTPMMGIPILGARLGGMAKATSAIMKASKETVSGRGKIANSPHLTKEEREAVEAFYDSGLIDRTQSHDLAGVGETGVEYSPLRAKWMARISWMFHNAEVWNREVTALAAYRMAREQGQTHEAAIDTAHDLTWKTHFDYSNSSRPTIMQGDFAKVAMVFRSHTINMMYRIARDVHQALKGETAQARKEARFQLAGIFGMMAAFSGTTGLFGFNLVMSLLGLVFGDEDDPFDFERRFRDGVVDALGPQLGGLVLNGIPGHYLGIDLTNRIGMADIWFRSPTRDLQGKDEFQYYVMNALGASVSMVGDALRGLQLASDGNWGRGLEAIAPKAVKDSLKSWRYFNEGLADLRGNEILPRGEIDGLDIVAQIIGFTPAKIVETYERNNALKNAEKRLLDRRRAAINRYALAVSQGDEETRREAMEAIKRFNASPYHAAIRITNETLRLSLKTRARLAKKREDGVLIQNPALGLSLRRQLAETVYR